MMALNKKGMKGMKRSRKDSENKSEENRIAVIKDTFNKGLKDIIMKGAKSNDLRSLEIIKIINKKLSAKKTLIN